MRVDVADVPRVTLVGLTLHAIPEVGEVVTVRATVPVNPATDVTVIVEVPAVPTFVVTLVGLAATVKLPAPTVKVTVAL